jgi:hypothetical protein
VKEARKAEERAERLRLYYVAMTRAIDRLVVSGSIDPTRTTEETTPIAWVLGRLDAAAEIEAAGGEPVDERHPPQGAGAVERMREQPPGDRAQLGGAARVGRPQGVDVVGDVEERVVGPLRVADPERRPDDAAPEARDPVEPRLDVAAQRRQRGRTAVEPHGPADVERRRGAVQVEERRVERAEAVGAGHEADRPVSRAVGA